MEAHDKGTIGDLARYRLEIAKNDLQAATILIKEKEYRGTNNRPIMQFIMQYPPFML